jgi:hypothetical protein
MGLFAAAIRAFDDSRIIGNPTIYYLPALMGCDLRKNPIVLTHSLFSPLGRENDDLRKHATPVTNVKSSVCIHLANLRTRRGWITLAGSRVRGTEIGLT